MPKKIREKEKKLKWQKGKWEQKATTYYWRYKYSKLIEFILSKGIRKGELAKFLGVVPSSISHDITRAKKYMKNDVYKQFYNCKNQQI